MLVLAFLLQTAAAPLPYEAPQVPDPELAEMRGGFRLPNGIDVALTVQTQTAINGNIVLHTVFRADQGTPSLSVFAPRDGEAVASDRPAATGTASASSMPVVTYDARNGLTVSRGAAAGPNIALGGTAAVPGGLQRIDTASGPIATQNGVISASGAGRVQTVDLRAGDLQLSHLSGGAFGAAVANSANDRMIDTVTTVSIDLRNAGPDVVGSTAFRLEDMALGALALRGN